MRLRAGASKFNYNSKIYYDGVLTKDESGQTELSPNLKPFDYGMVGGMGIAYPLQSIKIFVEARYHLGLRTIYKDGVDMFNRGPSVRLGVMLPL